VPQHPNSRDTSAGCAAVLESLSSCRTIASPADHVLRVGGASRKSWAEVIRFGRSSENTTTTNQTGHRPRRRLPNIAVRARRAARAGGGVGSFRLNSSEGKRSPVFSTWGRGGESFIVEGFGCISGGVSGPLALVLGGDLECRTVSVD
jgi:hypothetical protein